MQNTFIICNDCADKRRETFQQQFALSPVTTENWVKLSFQDKDQKSTTEHMWVRVTELIDRDHFRGTLDNIPVQLSGIAHGDTVEFTRQDIEAIL